MTPSFQECIEVGSIAANMFDRTAFSVDWILEIFLSSAKIMAHMAVVGIFRKKEKKEEKPIAPEPAQKPLLQELCGDDELYQVLSRTVLMNPQMTMKDGIDSYIEKARSFEEAGNHVRARIAYQAAGEISQFEGNLAQTQKFFKKAAEVTPDFANRKFFEYYSKKENAERALAIAQEYYTKTGKRGEKKENSTS